MDENPEGTPNPLNPNPGEHQELVSEPDTMPTTEAPRPAPTNTVVDNFITDVKTDGANDVTVDVHTETTSTEPPTAEPATTSAPVTGQPDPMSRPMEKAPVAEAKPVKKKKTGLIVGAIICLFLAIGCGVAAALILLNQKTDPVALAVDKIFSGNLPTNTTATGDINLSINNSESPFSDVAINFNANTVKNSLINSVNANVTATVQGGNEQISIELSEIYANNDDLYLKIDGATNAIEELLARQEILDPDTDEEIEIIDCETAEDCLELDTIDTDSSDLIESLGIFAGIIEAIDGEWLRVSSDDLSSFTDGIEGQESLSCVTDLISGANSNSIAKFYQDNPFIGSTNENISIASKANPVYLVTIDEEKFASFVEATSNAAATSEIFNCLDYQDTKVDVDEVVSELKNLPDIYVEVDGEHNFTRVYFTTRSDDGDTTATVDINLTYPTNVNISEPVEYQDLSTLLQNLFQSFYEY